MMKTTALRSLRAQTNEFDFYSYLLKHHNDIEDIIPFHLDVHKGTCKVAEELREWVRVSSNTCIPSTSMSQSNSVIDSMLLTKF